MEIFDVVDARGMPTGETVARDVAHQEGIRHRTAYVWVVRRRNGVWEVLLQKRSMSKDSFPGRLDTSSSGHIPAGCEPLASALRELQEELGVTAEPEALRFAGYLTLQYERIFHGHPFRDNEVSWVYVLEQDLPMETLTLQADEVDAVEWQRFETVRAGVERQDPAYCIFPDNAALLGEYLKSL